LEQLDCCKLDLLVPPLCGSVRAGDQPHPVDPTEVAIDEGVARLRAVLRAHGQAEVLFGVVVPRARLEVGVLVVARTAGIEIFDQAGGCVPPAAMVPVDGGVGDVLVIGVLCAGPPDQSRKQAVDGRAGLARRSKRVGIARSPASMSTPAAAYADCSLMGALSESPACQNLSAMFGPQILTSRWE